MLPDCIVNNFVIASLNPAVNMDLYFCKTHRANHLSSAAVHLVPELQVRQTNLLQVQGAAFLPLVLFDRRLFPHPTGLVQSLTAVERLHHLYVHLQIPNKRSFFHTKTVMG